MASERQKHYGKSQAGFTVHLMLGTGKHSEKITISAPWNAGSVAFAINQINERFAEHQSAPPAPEGTDGNP